MEQRKPALICLIAGIVGLGLNHFLSLQNGGSYLILPLIGFLGFYLGTYGLFDPRMFHVGSNFKSMPLRLQIIQGILIATGIASAYALLKYYYRIELFS